MATPLLLAAIGLSLFVAPHRGPQASAARRSLYGAFRDLATFAAMPSRRRCRILALGWLACLSVFLPAVLLAVLQALPFRHARWLLACSAFLLAVAAAAVWLLLLLSRTSFAFGASTARDSTFVAWAIQFWLAGSTGIAALGAAWGPCAAWVYYL